MTNEEAIKYLKQLYPNGWHCWLDEQRIEAIGMAIKALQKEPASEPQVKESFISKHDDKTCKENGDSLTQEPVSEDLDKEIANYIENNFFGSETMGFFSNKTKEELNDKDVADIARHFANWQKERIMANSTNATIGLPYENEYGGYTHLIDVSRPLSVGNNIIAIIFKED